MKRLATLTLAIGLATYGCGDSPSDPSDPPPGDTTSTTVYNLNLSPANERPAPISNTEASASGTATITLRVTRNASNVITAATADFQVNMAGFPAGSTITMAHIHPGDATTTGSIIVNTGLTSGEAALTNGAASFLKSNVPVLLDVAQGILNAPANFYFNVHSALNPPGVLRAQMNNTGAPAQEPGAEQPPAPGGEPYPYPVK